MQQRINTSRLQFTSTTDTAANTKKDLLINNNDQQEQTIEAPTQRYIEYQVDILTRRIPKQIE
jgi:hypothetical protein